MKKGESLWQLDHVGHAVKNLDEAVAFYTSKLGHVLCSRESLPNQKVEVAFLSHDETSTDSGLIELLAPLNGEGPVQKFLDSRGAGLHHVAYHVASVSQELARLQSEGVVVIDKEPRKGARGHYVAFLHPKSCEGVLVELCSQLF